MRLSTSVQPDGFDALRRLDEGVSEDDRRRQRKSVEAWYPCGRFPAH